MGPKLIDDINFSLRCGSKVYCIIYISLQQNNAFLPAGGATKGRNLRPPSSSTSRAAESSFAPVENSVSSCDINCSLQRTGINRLFSGNLAGARRVAEISENFS
jgi:hypothetical protein